jgi:hypothetical protein
MFYLLSGTAEFRCDGQALRAAPDEPLRALQITTPAGFEHFAADAGETRAPAAAPRPRARSRPRRRPARPRTTRPAPTALTPDRLEC